MNAFATRLAPRRMLHGCRSFTRRRQRSALSIANILAARFDDVLPSDSFPARRADLFKRLAMLSLGATPQITSTAATRNTAPPL